MRTSTTSTEDKRKRTNQSRQGGALRENMDKIITSSPADILPFVNRARDKEASSWLNAIPLEDEGLVLNKQEFRD